MALAALVLYLPANLLPIVLVQYQGRHIEVTIVDAIRNLFSTGHFFVGVLVLCTSFLTPALKILGLLFVTFAPSGSWILRWRRRVYDLIGVLNPWNYMEIFLLAMVLTLVDFGALATVRAGPGATTFAAVVVLTTAGTVVFQPAALWRGNRHESERVPSQIGFVREAAKQDTDASKIEKTTDGGRRRVVGQTWAAQQVVAQRRLSRHV